MLSLFFVRISLPLVTDPNPMALGYKTHLYSATVIGPETIISVKQELQKAFPGFVLAETGSKVPAFISWMPQAPWTGA